MSSRASSEDPTKIELLKDALYQAVVDNGTESRLWNQKELLDLDVIPEQNLVLLMKAVQGLCQDFLFKAMNDGRFGLCWRWRSVEDAQKYRTLNQDQTMVYELIDDAGADGIWARSLKLRLNMHESVLRSCLKHLEGRGYIRDMKSVENIGKKMYIKATLRPSDRATGGPWYTDALLDENFIASLQDIVFQSIRNRSTYLSRAKAPNTSSSGLRQPRKGAIKGGPPDGDAPARGRKRGVDALSTDDPKENGHGRHHREHHHRRRVHLPMPAGYTEYPTVRKIAELIEESGVANNTTLGTTDIQQLVDVLVYDGVLEAVRLPGSNETGYRALNAVRLPADGDLSAAGGGGPDEVKRPAMGGEPLNNGFTEAPCGLCPVFDLCEDGGPVSPANCVYFNRWLGLEDSPTPVARAAGDGDEDVEEL